jgi:uncharacterized protein YcbK (DUF882 family)/LysM repeat protein
MRPQQNNHFLFCVVALLLGICVSPTASAQSARPRYYAVVNGDTLWTIAQRYHVTAPELADRNHLREPFALRRGMQLHLPSRAAVVPDANPSAPPAAAATTSARTLAVAASRTRPVSPPPVVRASRTEHSNATRPGGRWGRPSHPGIVRLVRVNDGESIVVDLRRIGPVTFGRMRSFLRAGNGATHAIDGRLLRQLGIFSDHFGGRRIEVVSGFRPRRRRQYTAHSKHNIGHAIDFRVEGVPNRVARDFCHTFQNTGCGFYPRSVFIHMDTRAEPTTWVDWSRPGERPRYGSESHAPPVRRRPAPNVHPATNPDPEVPPVGADPPELDDVANDTPAVRTAEPPHDDSPDDNSPAPAPAPAPAPPASN